MNNVRYSHSRGVNMGVGDGHVEYLHGPLLHLNAVGAEVNIHGKADQ